MSNVSKEQMLDYMNRVFLCYNSICDKQVYNAIRSLIESSGESARPNIPKGEKESETRFDHPDADIDCDQPAPSPGPSAGYVNVGPVRCDVPSITLPTSAPDGYRIVGYIKHNPMEARQLGEEYSPVVEPIPAHPRFPPIDLPPYAPSATPTIIIPVDKYFFVRDGERAALYEKLDDGQPGNLICEIPPAPPPEVEEAMENIRDGIEYAGGQLGWHDYEGLTTSFAVIRAALSKGAEWEKRWAELVETVAVRTDQVRTMEVKPIRATRAFVETHAMAVYRAYDQHDAKALMGHALRELGIVVEVKL
jgi:hypothetical protein